MAKFCVNCNKKISFMADQFSMIHVNKTFCADCMDEAKKMLEPIKILVIKERLPEVKADFQKALSASRYNEDVRKLIKMEFDQISGSFVEYSVYQMKRFQASFEESYEAIRQTGVQLTGESGQSNPPVIAAGEAKIATFVFEQYFFRNGSYASLTVTLVNYRDINTITTVGSGGGDGMFNFSWGAEEDFVKDFWDSFRLKYPDFDLQDVDITEMQVQQAGPDGKLSAENLVQSHINPVLTGRIGILGGSFDPIHNGHVTLGKAAIKEAGLDKLIIMPTHVSPFKIGRDYADDEHRLNMCRLAFEGTDRAEVSKYEMEHTEVSYTYDTLKYLKEVYPDHTLYFITGTDSFLDIEYWHKGTQLLENFSFIVSERPGYRENELEERIRYYKERYKTEIIRLNHDMPDISSTKIKARRVRDISIKDMVPASVERYINEHKLYL